MLLVLKLYLLFAAMSGGSIRNAFPSGGYRAYGHREFMENYFETMLSAIFTISEGRDSMITSI